MNRRLLTPSFLFVTAAAIASVAFLPSRSASSADPVPTSASAVAPTATAPVTPCEEVCSTARRALGECDLADGPLLAAINEQARRAQLDCKAYCATASPDEVQRIDACFPRQRCGDYRACLSALGTTKAPSNATTRERDGAEMVTIPAGPVVLGVPGAARTLRDVERTSREVGAFRIDRFEVSVAQYRRCFADGACPPPSVDGQPDPATLQDPSESAEGEEKPPTLQGCNWGMPGRAKHPVNCVDYHSARAYCRWAGARLPSELEWEKAARGADGRRFPWGFADRTCSRLTWDPGNSLSTRGCSQRSTSEVGSHPGGDSPYGVSDMSGNVWEWVGGLYDEKAYADPKTDDLLTPAQVYGVIRGGGYGRDDGDVVSHDASTRFRWFKQHRREGVGFRCATEAP
jgi:formylglycine-generating enzyme required for sulfatase activity